ncbi:MAG TPA: protein kinase [Planctomycetota bacterium]|nr:protein kinase [Planctomycetota bacterium]
MQPSAENTVIGGCELLEKLGKGGNGVVYRARQLSVGRVVAVKILRPALSQDAVYVERFLREARTAARLNHPNIVNAIDAGCDQGHYYFVMEYVDGVTVRKRLDAGPLAEQEALRIARDIAAALAHANRHAVVHRDVKPDNIMLAADGAAKLADLGLAKNFTFDVNVTLESSALGTPHYMSPEQARGETRIDIRSDIYSLGATLYHMLTGVPPFRGDTPAAVLTKRLLEAPPNPREQRPDISLATSLLIQRMMARDPEKRFATPDELLAAIDSLPRHKAAPAEQPAAKIASRSQPKPASRPSRGLIAFGSAALVIIAVVAVAMLVGGRGKPAADPAAEGYRAAQSYAQSNPKDLDGQMARFEAIVRKYAGSQWAASADAKVRELQAAKAQLKLQGELSSLKVDCTKMIREDRFTAALASIGQFRSTHNAPQIERDLADLEAAVGSAVKARLERSLRLADEALGAKDYAATRAALDQLEALRIPGADEAVRKKRQEIDSREKNADSWAKWEAAKAEIARLLGQGNYEQAAKVLDSARTLPLPEIAELVAEQAKAIDVAAAQAAKAAADRARSALKEHVEPLLAKRRYADAAAALAKLAERDDLRAAAAQLEHDIAWLDAFWQNLEKRLVSLKEGESVSIGGKAARLVSFKEGKLRYAIGQAETAADIATLPVKDLLGLLGPQLPANDESRLQAALLLLYDADADPVASYAMLAGCIEETADSRRYRELAEQMIRAGFEAAETAAEATYAIFGDDPLGKPGDAFRSGFAHTLSFNQHLLDLQAADAAAPIVRKLSTWSDHRYLGVPEYATWHGAKARCERLGGHLVSIASPQENAFIVKEFTRPLAAGGRPTLWLGATDDGHEGRWQWVNGEKWSFSPWIKGTPDNHQGVEHFLQLLVTGNAPWWNDAPAASTCLFVCEWDEPSRFTLDAVRELLFVMDAAPRPNAAGWRKALGKRISCSSAAVPLKYAIIGIVNQAEVPCQGEKSSAALGEAAGLIVNVAVERKPASEALDQLLKPLNLRYEIEDAGLRLVAASAPSTAPADAPIDLAAARRAVAGSVDEWNPVTLEIKLSYDFAKPKQVDDWTGGALDEAGRLRANGCEVYSKPQFASVSRIEFDGYFIGGGGRVCVRLRNGFVSELGGQGGHLFYQTTWTRPLIRTDAVEFAGNVPMRCVVELAGGAVVWRLNRKLLGSSRLAGPIASPTAVGFGHPWSDTRYDNVQITGQLDRAWLSEAAR